MMSLPRLAIFSPLGLFATLATVVAAGCAETGPNAGAGPAAEACSSEGTGSIAVTVVGLPDGVAANVKLTGPSGLAMTAAATETLGERPAGAYAVTAERVAKPDPIVRTLYEPSLSTSAFCLDSARAQTVTVTYAEVTVSNKLWFANATGGAGQLLAFAGADLDATGTPNAKVAVKGARGGGAGRAVAFDREGNLWTFGATKADTPILRFDAESLGESGEKTPDRKIDTDVASCSPGFEDLAFDPSGALWTTVPCADTLVRLSPEMLDASRKHTPAAGDVVSGIDAPYKIAFDGDGNMWVSAKASLHRFPAPSLAPGQPHVPDFALTAKSERLGELLPGVLAFDRQGNLWVTTFGGNVVYKLSPSDLAPAGATKEVVPSVEIVVSVGAELESLAFDESGGLWLTFIQGTIARLSPAQLETSSVTGDARYPETVVTSPDIGYAGKAAFFPAPAGLPLYGRLE